MRRAARVLVTLALVAGLGSLAGGCLPPPREPTGLPPPPPTQSDRRCPGPRLRCLSGEECVHDRERDCVVCRCRPGYDADRKDDQRGDPRWIYDESDR